MKISEFADKYGVEQSAIRKYLSRHPEIKRHREGASIELPDESVELLARKYGSRQQVPVQIIEGVSHEQYESALEQLNEARERLAGAFERMNSLLEERAEDQKKLAEAEAAQFILQDKERQIEDEKRRADELQAELTAKDREADELRAEVERLKNRGLLARIRNL